LSLAGDIRLFTGKDNCRWVGKVNCRYTLDHLIINQANIEVALYGRLRDLFHFQPDLVFYDLTSTYFEGHGPAALAKHGYSRDGQPRNVQVVV